MRISDWSSDVCSSDLALAVPPAGVGAVEHRQVLVLQAGGAFQRHGAAAVGVGGVDFFPGEAQRRQHVEGDVVQLGAGEAQRSEEHTSELQSLMRISYAVFCLKKKKPRHQNTTKKE